MSSQSDVEAELARLKGLLRAVGTRGDRGRGRAGGEILGRGAGDRVSREGEQPR